MEATILELLRYKTIAPFAVYHRTVKDTEVGGYFVPGGTTVRSDTERHKKEPSFFSPITVFPPDHLSRPFPLFLVTFLSCLSLSILFACPFPWFCLSSFSVAVVRMSPRRSFCSPPVI